VGLFYYYDYYNNGLNTAQIKFMFKCQNCGKVVPPKTKCCKVVVVKRKKAYPYRSKVNPGYYYNDNEQMVRSDKWKDRTDDKGGIGNEASQEKLMCPECATKFTEKATE
jgi:hypothetical protein